GGGLQIAIDTKPIRGRGAVQDTFNLLATGIMRLGRALAKQAKQTVAEILQASGLHRYTQSSLKGSADIDWSDEQARNGVLTQVVGDVKRLLSMATSQEPSVRAAAELLKQL